MRHAIHRVGSQRDAETIARAVFAHAPTAVRIVRRHRYDAYGYRVGVGYVVAFQDHSTHEWLWDHPCRPTPLSRRLHALSPDVFMIYLAWFEAGTRSVADCMQWVAQARHQRKQ